MVSARLKEISLPSAVLTAPTAAKAVVSDSNCRSATVISAPHPSRRGPWASLVGGASARGHGHASDASDASEILIRTPSSRSRISFTRPSFGGSPASSSISPAATASVPPRDTSPARVDA